MRVLDMDVIATRVIEKTGKTGKPYDVMEVTYRYMFQGKPKTEGKQLFKFNTPQEVWDKLEQSVSGDSFTIEIEKNEKGYLDWVSIATQTDSLERGDTTKEPSKLAEAKNRFDEADEKRQRSIVRQSSLAQAVQIGIATGDLDLDTIKTTAEALEQWVNRQ